MKYQEAIKYHLKNYKKNCLGITQNGIWKNNKKQYPHILPLNLYRLNILKTYEDSFWEFFNSEESGTIKLHKDFHHLNSSQAMCFNLFFPFLNEGRHHLDLLLSSIYLEKEGINEIAFEKILYEKEGTNFDFFIEYKSGKQIFFEVKLSEARFGSTRADDHHIYKFRKIYKPVIKNCIKSEFLDKKDFFSHYQIMRHIFYLGYSKNNHIIFIIPERNESLKNSVPDFSRILKPGYVSNVKLIYLETLFKSLNERLNLYNHELLIKHFDLFAEKYLHF